MELIVPLILIFIAVLVMFIRLVVRRSNESRYRDNLVSDDDLNLETRKRLLRYLALFGLTITSGIAFIGILVLFFSFTTEARMTGNFMDDFFPSILSGIGVVVGVLGTIGIVRLYKKI
jgi:ABC-type Fe3+ transport system permease subunit